MFWITVAAAVALDQAVKYAVATNMQVGQSIPVIDGLFHLTYVLNQGAAFSILQGQRWFFVLATLAVMVGVLWLLRDVPKTDRLMRFSLSLFCGGALGNFTDRLLRGAVVDLFDFRVFPVFNVADSCIVVGVILLGWCLLKSGKPKITKGESI